MINKIVFQEMMFYGSLDIHLKTNFYAYLFSCPKNHDIMLDNNIYLIVQ